MARLRRSVVRFATPAGDPVQVPAALLADTDPARRTISTARRWLLVLGIDAPLDDVQLAGHPLGLPSQRRTHRRIMAARAWAESCGLDWRILGDQDVQPFVRPWSRQRIARRRAERK